MEFRDSKKRRTGLSHCQISRWCALARPTLYGIRWSLKCWMSFKENKEKFQRFSPAEKRRFLLTYLRPHLLDISLWTLVLGNLFSIYVALVQRWPLGEILWIYWAQSVIIGISNYIRMMSLKDFTTEGT